MWEHKIRASLLDRYRGMALTKLPEDLRVYEQLLWEQRPDVLIELGGFRGGSAWWFHDRMILYCDKPLVVTVEIEPDRVVPDHPGVLIGGDVCAPSTRDDVASHVPDDARVMVVEDSAHTYETTRAALEFYAPFVTTGSFFVVEDTVVDMEELRVFDDWPRGVQRALNEWLPGQPFKVRDDFGRYGYSTNWGGLLERV
jgi:cephalosporin hydroxylase